MSQFDSQSSYQTQLNEKAAWLADILSPFSSSDLAVFDSPQVHYRMRAEFRVWHDGNDLYHIMFDQKTKQSYRVDQFPAASQTINTAMELVIKHLRNNACLRKKLFQIDYLSGLSNEIVVSLLYHRKLDEEWEREIDALKNTLSSELHIDFIGRAKKQKYLHDRDHIIERLTVGKKDYVFKHIENSFTQPNAVVNIKMIEWVQSLARDLTGDLLELYCGAGNFSIPLASCFDRVIGTEIAKPSVEAAQFNIEQNDIDNVRIVRLSAEEFVDALAENRIYKRLEGVELKQYNFKTVLVDPPRAGLDDATLKCIQAFDNIVYISCNPITLQSNLQELCKTHDLQHSALFDQFPFTHHVEAGVFLSKQRL
jgi:tRNA (uracil-5-)-methyltransferase